VNLWEKHIAPLANDSNEPPAYKNNMNAVNSMQKMVVLISSKTNFTLTIEFSIYASFK
jgi:phage-related tail fiber protein